MEKVKIGIIGIGNMGTTHAKNIANGECPELELAAVADINKSRREWAKKELPETVEVYSDGSELIKSADIDAVLIAVPHYSHPTLAIEAFGRGLHVMCEKPAGVYTKAVRQMNAAAEKSGKVFGMMFNQRLNCVYRKLKELVSDGGFGEIRRVNWIITDWYRTQSYYDSGSWRATWAGEGGGVLLNQCPHNLDLLQWICGMPTKVRAMMHEGKWHDIEVEDDVTAYLEYENGATGVFVTTTGDAPGTNRLEITMDGAKLVCSNDKLTLYKLSESLKTHIVDCKEGFQKPGWEEQEVPTDGDNPSHIGILNRFAAAILHGAPLAARGEEGINGLTLSNAMHLSAWLDRTVEIPFDEDLFLNELNKRRENSRLKTTEAVVFDTEGSY